MQNDTLDSLENKVQELPATAEEIVDKLSQLGEIYPASKEELKEAINNAE